MSEDPGLGPIKPGEEGQPIPLGYYIYHYIMGHLHNLLADLAEELNNIDTAVIPKDDLIKRLMELPDEGETNGSH